MHKKVHLGDVARIDHTVPIKIEIIDSEFDDVNLEYEIDRLNSLILDE